MEFDHFAISGETLGAATAHLEAALGVSLEPGGAHDRFHTHNKLLGLEDGLYLEAIAVQPDVPKPDWPRWFDLDRFAGPARTTNWICRVPNLDAALAQLPDSFGKGVEVRRGDLTWRMAVPDSGRLPFDNCAPALIEWGDTAHPSTRLGSAGFRMSRFEVSHPEVAELAAILKPHLQDDRLEFVVGPAGLCAHLEGPKGVAVLS